MKKYSFLLLLSLAAFPIVAHNQNLNGSYKIVKAFYGRDKDSLNLDSTKVVKIFKDGYWIAALFGRPANPFGGTGGGTYKTENGKYIETLHFFSWDSTAVGATYLFDYKLAANKFYQEGKINSDKYKDYLIKEEYDKLEATEPLKDPGLEGVWILKNASWNETENGQPANKDLQELKIYSYPRFAWAQYNPKTKQFIGAGGGTYQFDGSKLIENLDYITYDMKGVTRVEMDIMMQDKQQYHQSMKESGFAETWIRAK